MIWGQGFVYNSSSHARQIHARVQINLSLLSKIPYINNNIELALSIGDYDRISDPIFCPKSLSIFVTVLSS